ncbi:Hypothetical predicted protein [Pelobates cultripes]|uniref:Uncharacterized protein n=1 Tax=Pelobates cultripes TaxID=61616 RepID=A0AAD1WT29_PELCU|nr:Hypothetical predicted protein [Pelobates cultripes]
MTWSDRNPIRMRLKSPLFRPRQTSLHLNESLLTDPTLTLLSGPTTSRTKSPLPSFNTTKIYTIFFEEHWTLRHSEGAKPYVSILPLRQIDEHDCETLETRITPEKLALAIKKAKTGRSLGPDSLLLL